MSKRKSYKNHRPLTDETQPQQEQDELIIPAYMYFCAYDACPAYNILVDIGAPGPHDCTVCEFRMTHFDGANTQHRALFNDDAPPLTIEEMVELADSATTELIDLTSSSSTAKALPAHTEAKEEPAVFESNCDVTGKCPLVSHKGLVKMPYGLYQRCIFLTHAFNCEWIAYLHGTVEPNGTVVLDEHHSPDEGWHNGMFFPMQKATGAHVDAETASVPAGCIASIHSHVDMSTSFSKEDNDHFNHPADLVCNRAGRVNAVVQHTLECGRSTRIEAETFIAGTSTDVGIADILRSKLVEDKSRVDHVGPEWKDKPAADEKWNRLSPSAVPAVRGFGGTTVTGFQLYDSKAERISKHFSHSTSRVVDDRDLTHGSGRTPGVLTSERGYEWNS